MSGQSAVGALDAGVAQTIKKLLLDLWVLL